MILVTGANGLAGSAVIREFARAHVLVRALVRSRAKAQALEAFPTVELVEGDMLRPQTLTNALAGVERVLLISSPNGQMVQTQCTFIDAAKEAGVRHIIKLSGVTTSLDSPFLFSRQHAEISDYLERSGLDWTFLRPSQFATEYLREVPSIIADGAFYLPFEDTTLGIHPTPFVEFARCHAADFLGTSAWAKAQKGRKHPLDLRDLPRA